MMLPRVSVVLLLFIFLYNSVGYYLTFRLDHQRAKSIVKNRIKNSIPENELIRFSFKPSSASYENIEWVEPHEFRYQGELYDVVRESEDEYGYIHYYCINDKQEEHLFANLEQHIKKHISETKGEQDQSGQKTKKDKQDFLSGYSRFAFSLSSIGIFNLYQQIPLQKTPKPIFIPPPEHHLKSSGFPSSLLS